MTTQYAIDRPGKCLPGTGDDSGTNETIRRCLTAPWVRHYPSPPREREREREREPQIGRPATAPAQERPDPRCHGHEAWPVGPVRTASASASASVSASGEAVR